MPPSSARPKRERQQIVLTLYCSKPLPHNLSSAVRAKRAKTTATMTTPAKTQTAIDARVIGSELKTCMTKTRSENNSGITNIQEGGQSGRSTPRSGETLELLLWAMTLFLIR